MRRVRTYIIYVWYRWIGAIFRILPIKKGRIVFMNFFGKGYGDNPKYICEELIKHNNNNLELLWFVKKDTLGDFPDKVKVIPRGTLKELYYLSTANVWVDNSRKHLGVKKRKKQLYIQTWHGGIALKKIENEGIRCIVNGCDIVSNNEVLELSSRYGFIYSAIGFHPSEVEKVPDNYISYLEKNIDSVVAIGEIGLDYYWVKDNKNEQIELFESQLKLAEKYNKPVIIHSRDAWNDTYNILSKYKVKGVIHAFSGSLEMANLFIKLGFKLGIGGVITFKNCNLKDVIKEIDINNIVLETDSPYLSPEPLRGKQNSPLNLKYIAEFISNIKDISYIDVCKITSNNASKLFDL